MTSVVAKRNSIKEKLANLLQATAAAPALLPQLRQRLGQAATGTAAQGRRMLNNARWRFNFLEQWFFMLIGVKPPRQLDGDPALGLTFVLPGIESESAFTYAVCDGLIRGGVNGAVRVFNWGLPFPGGYLSNLCRIDRNRRRAKDLADLIVRYQDAYPNRPVNLVAHSGGCGVAVWTVEALPEGRSVDRVVLLNGALSPDYDLTKALRKVRHGILNSHSCRDVMILGLGTRIFGTTDRKFSEACGLKGFVMPPNLSPEDRKLYEEKLTQVPWCEDMIATCGHVGGHLTSANEPFLHRYICPWLNPAACSTA